MAEVKETGAHDLPDLALAFVQTRLAWENPDANRARFERLLSRLQSRPDLIVLPETFTTGFPVDPRRWAEKTNGESIRWLRSRARETGAVLCASLLVSCRGRYYNRLVWMPPEGRPRYYDKRHVFRMGGEHKRIEPGRKQVRVRLKGWSISPMVCYDLRFPVWCRNTYERGRFGYDLQLFVANWPAARAGPWRQLLTARAVENQAYVLGVNRIGRDGRGMAYAGYSRLVDPKGRMLANAGPREEAVVETVIRGSDLTRLRRKFNVGQDWDRFTLSVDSPG